MVLRLAWVSILAKAPEYEVFGRETSGTPGPSLIQEIVSASELWRVLSRPSTVGRDHWLGDEEGRAVYEVGSWLVKSIKYKTPGQAAMAQGIKTTAH